MILHELFMVRAYIFKRKYEKAVDKIFELLDKKLSTKQRSNIYLTAVSILEDIQMDKLDLMYKHFIYDKTNDLDLENQTDFLIFASLVNFLLYHNYQYVNIEGSKDSFREKAIDYLNKLEQLGISTSYLIKLRICYLRAEVADENYTHAIEIYDSLLDNFWKMLPSRVKNVLLFYKGICDFGLGKENIALSVFMGLEMEFNTNSIYDRYIRCKIYEALGRIYENRGKTNLAKDYYHKAINIIDGIDVKEHEYEMKKEVQDKLDGLR